MKQLTIIQLRNNTGDEVHIANLGARLTKWQTLVDGKPRNIVVGYDDATGYLNDPYYMGAIVGPMANRIKNAQFAINNTTVSLTANEGNNQLHGGPNSIESMLWQYQLTGDNQVHLTCDLPEGFNGYPGKIKIETSYLLTDESALNIKVKVSSDKPTLAGPTSHPYFNLSGEKSAVNDHYLEIAASQFTPLDDENVPFGEIQNLDQHAFDFRQAKQIKLGNNGLIDNNFIIDETNEHKVVGGLFESVVKHAQVTAPTKDLTLTASSNYPAIQVYTGEHLKNPYVSCQGVCLEPQFTPNSVNLDGFPFCFVTPQKPLEININYALTKQ